MMLSINGYSFQHFFIEYELFMASQMPYNI